MKDYLFAYGTLAEDRVPLEIASAVKRLKYVGDGFIFGRLYDLGDYPGAVLDAGARRKIFGKIYELPSDSKLLNRLDTYEEFDPERPSQSLFVRKQTSINRPNKKTVKGWVYEYNKGVRRRPLIEHGRYSKKAG